MVYKVINCSEGVMFLLNKGTEVFDPCSFILLSHFI